MATHCMMHLLGWGALITQEALFNTWKLGSQHQGHRHEWQLAGKKNRNSAPILQELTSLAFFPASHSPLDLLFCI